MGLLIQKSAVEAPGQRIEKGMTQTACLGRTNVRNVSRVAES